MNVAARTIALSGRREQACEEVGDRLAATRRAARRAPRGCRPGSGRPSYHSTQRALEVADGRPELGQLLDELARLVGDRRQDEGERSPRSIATATAYETSTPAQRGTPRRASAVTTGSSTNASARPMKNAGSAPARQPQQQQDDRDHEEREERLAVALHGRESAPTSGCIATRRSGRCGSCAGTMSGR